MSIPKITVKQGSTVFTGETDSIIIEDYTAFFDVEKYFKITRPVIT